MGWPGGRSRVLDFQRPNLDRWIEERGRGVRCTVPVQVLQGLEDESKRGRTCTNSRSEERLASRNDLSG